MSIIQGTSKTSAAGGYAIDQSIRFNDDDSARMTRTPGSAGNRRTFTFSAWIKRGYIAAQNSGDNQDTAAKYIFSASGNDRIQFSEQSQAGSGQRNDGIHVEIAGSASGVYTTARFSDPGSWYHLVVEVDTTQATASNRIKIYINGSQLTDFDLSNYPSQNAESAFNNTVSHMLGGRVDSTSNFFDGYLAEINFIDGTALDPTSFGETNADTGQWVPIEYTGSYGTNGFYLKGQDSSALGDDSSGNGNDYATTNLAANDQVTDTPTDNHCTLNPLDGAGTLSDGNLVNAAPSASFVNRRMTFGVPSSGKWAFNVKKSANNFMVGVIAPQQTDGDPDQNNIDALYYYDKGGTSSGVLQTRRSGAPVAETTNPPPGIAVDTFMEVLIDKDNNQLGVVIGGTAYIAVDAGVAIQDTMTQIFVATASSTATVDFGQSGFTPSQTGYKPLSTANLDDPTIALPEKYFNTVLYEGNGGGQRVGGFQPITETYTVPNSVIFNDNDSAYLNRTPASDGNRQTMTFSWWMKRGNLNITDCRIFTAFDTNDDQINFKDTSDYNRLDVFFDGTGGGRLITSRAFDDSSTWNHCVVAIDTTQATSGDRVKIYINGVRVTEFDTETQPSLNKNLNGFNNNGVHAIGARGWSGAAGFYDGYLAEIYFIDGQQLDASSFGQLDASTNKWIPKDASGLTFGTNGYYLDMETAPGTGSGAGTDSSGNGNNFTESGLAAADQVTDSPTDNFSVLNPNDNGRPANITLSDGNLTAAFSGAGYQGGIRSSIFFDSEDSDGWYAECTLDSLAFASIFRAGVANASLDLSSTDAQNDANGWAYSDQGAKLNNSYTTGYGSSVTVGDVVGIAVRNGKIYFAVNNTWQGSADPVTESNPAFSNLTGDVAFCQSTSTGGSYAHTATWNFGQKSFAYTPPTGYKTVSADNLPLSNGDLSAFVWIKNRDATDNHMLFDAVRGATKDVHSNTTDLEATNANTLTRFLKNGFEVGNDVQVNTSGESYVAWQWLNDSLSTSSNSDGTVSSTVLANTTAGFSIAKWTHTTASNYTVGHGLGAVPKMILVKTTDQATNWGVYHSDITVGNRLILNSTSAQVAGYWGANSWTSSTFSIGSARDANGSTMIAYSFAEVEGFSKFISYEGNASTDGPFIYCGFRPSYVLIKNIDAAEEWWIQDAAREPYNGGNMARIAPNSSAAESDNVAWFDFVSNGLKVRYNAGGINSSGTHIVMAFAESPFKTATAR